MDGLAGRARHNWRVLLVCAVVLALGLWMRLWMLNSFPQIFDDTYIYGNIASNILHGSYALTDGSGAVHGTLIRLPGYPLFLAGCFKLFGVGNYLAVQWLQIGMDLFGALMLADFARRWSGSRLAGVFTLVIAALCPFTAIYSTAPLAEAPTLFLVAVALWSLQRFSGKAEGGAGWVWILLFTFAITVTALLRPDGVLVGVVLFPALLLTGWRKSARVEARRKLMVKAAAAMVLAALPFAAWTWRNWERFHVVEPLAPRYATDPGEPTYPGFQKWTKTWCLDFVSTYQIYWNFPDERIDVGNLPGRAFDSAGQWRETAALLDDYNTAVKDSHGVGPELDARFMDLADKRIRANPLRYYLWLPMGRVADMWLHPRVENLPIDLDWWVYSHHHTETRISWALAGLNALYMLLGVAGLLLRPRWVWAMLAYFVLRSLMLATIEAPEARYTLECFPMLFALGGYLVGRKMKAWWGKSLAIV